MQSITTAQATSSYAEHAARVAAEAAALDLPRSLAAAIEAYVAEGRDLSAVQRAWEEALRERGGRAGLPLRKLPMLAEGWAVGESDLRLVDIWVAAENGYYYHEGARRGGLPPPEAMLERLRGRAFDEILWLQRHLRQRPTLFFDLNGDEMYPLGELAVLILADRLDEAVLALRAIHPYWNDLVRLPLLGSRPRPDLALRLALAAPASYLVRCANLVLQADAAHFSTLRPALERAARAAADDLELLRMLLPDRDTGDPPYGEAVVWEGQLAFAVAKLADSAPGQRAMVVEWLGRQGEPAAVAVAPLLGAPAPEVRLAAAGVLHRVGGPAARAALAAAPPDESDRAVREAIGHALGLPELEGLPDDAARAAHLEAVARALPARKRPPLPFLAELPPLRWANGAPADPALTLWLLALAETRRGEPLSERARQAAALLNRDAAQAWGEAAARAWLAADAPAKLAWCLPLICRLGGDRAVAPLAAAAEGWVKGARRVIAAETIAALAESDTPGALAALDRLAARLKPGIARDAALRALGAAARRRGLSSAQLGDLVAPRLGLDDDGGLRLDYGPRAVTARVGPGQPPELRDEAGRPLKSLPKPAPGDDPALAAAAAKAWKELRATLPRALSHQAARLEAAMVERRAWAAPRWRELIMGHPLLRRLAAGLVWEAGGALLRPLEDGLLLDAAGDAVALPDTAELRLAHPALLADEQLQAWMVHLDDYEVAPPFAQLGRRVVRPTPEEAGLTRWMGAAGATQSAGPLWTAAQRAGWRRGPIGDGGMYYTLWRLFPAQGLAAFLLLEDGVYVGGGSEYPVLTGGLGFLPGAAIPAATPERGGLALGAVPPVVLSEAAIAALALAGRGA